MYQIKVNRVIPANIETLYDIVADYEVGHPAILPKEFTALVVEPNDTLIGTRMRADMKVLGQEQSLYLFINDAQRPDYIIEGKEDSEQITRFLFEPQGDALTNVIIETDFEEGNGIGGWIEKQLMKRLIPSMYERELENLENYAKQQIAS